MKDKLRRLKDLGFKITPQRMAVIDFLEGNRSHPSAGEIYEVIKKKFPSISLATVYNTVDTLVGNGLLAELSLTRDKSNYDPDTSDHDHAICVKCSRIFDRDPGPGTGHDADKTDPGGQYTILSVRKIFSVLCKNCGEKQPQ